MSLAVPSATMAALPPGEMPRPAPTTRRPSLLDPGLPGEPGLGPCVCMPNVVVLYLLNRPVAIIHATPMDQASLEAWLARVRSRTPRLPVVLQAYAPIAEA